VVVIDRRMHANEELIDTVDVWRLHQFRWPFLRLLSRRFVIEMELGRYMRRLLATGAWTHLRIVPHPTERGPSDHLFDVYGVRIVPPEGAPISRALADF
jgi:hypothetical protein